MITVNVVILLLIYYYLLLSTIYMEHVATLRNTAISYTGFRLYCVIPICTRYVIGSCILRAIETEEESKIENILRDFNIMAPRSCEASTFTYAESKFLVWFLISDSFQKSSWKSQVLNSRIPLGCQCYISLKSILYRSPIVLVNIYNLKKERLMLYQWFVIKMRFRNASLTYTQVFLNKYFLNKLNRIVILWLTFMSVRGSSICSTSFLVYLYYW